MKNPIELIKAAYKERTFLSSLFSFVATVSFALYNGVLGIIHGSIWNGSICIYYLLLMVAKFLIITNKGKDKSNALPYVVYGILLIINISMIAPSVFLIKGEKNYTWGLIPAIANAAYTTYSIVMASIHLRQDFHSDNVYVRQSRVVSVISSLMSVIVLQNTLITVNSGMNDDMRILSFWTTNGMLAIAIVISVISLTRYISSQRNKEEK